ncbi:hypothetical protein ACFL5P_02965, partial [candidate division KSB1 bacterium]
MKSIENRITPYRLLIILSIFIFVLLCGMMYAFYTGIKMNEKYKSQVMAAYEIRINLTLGHLWFEELLSGDSSIDVEVITKSFDKSDMYSSALLEGGESEIGTIYPVDDQQVITFINDIINETSAFRDLAVQRLDDRSGSGTGTLIDQQYDTIFNQILISTQSVIEWIQDKNAKDLNTFRLSRTLVIILFIVLFIMIIAIVYLYFKEQESSKKELSESEMKFRSIVESIPIGLHFYNLKPDKSLIFSGANPAADKILGVENNKFIGKTIEEAYPNLKETEIPDIYRKVASTGYLWHTNQVNYEDEDILGAFEVLAFQTSPGNMTASFFDITDRVRAEKEREKLTIEIMEKNKELEQIVYVTSHDLRSPLVNVQGFSNELKESVNDLSKILSESSDIETAREKSQFIFNHDIPDSLKFIFNGITKMDSLLSGLLRISRLGRMPMILKKLDMKKLIDDVINTFEYEIKEYDIDVIIRDLPICWGDLNQMNQLFSNLISNAIRNIDKIRKNHIRITGLTK